jgi:dihydrolipoamide dehydrogenase
MTDIECQVLVIGAGPGGYVAAIRAGQHGLDTVIVDKGPMGGTCLNVGCIPSKAMIHAADAFAAARRQADGGALGITVASPKINLAETVKWKDGIVSRLNNGVAGLLKRARVRVVEGAARFRDGKTVEVATKDGTQLIRAQNIIIATGSAPVELPNLPFGGRVISSTEALALEDVPGKLVVVGAGYIGLELGIAFAKLGSAVTVVEATDRILPTYDKELTRPVSRRLDELGVEVLTGAKAKELAKGGKSLVIEDKDGKERKLTADQVLVTVGRRPVTGGWGLEEIDLTMNGRFIAIDERCRTSMRGVYAIGDVTGEPMLAHRAMAQGAMVADILAGEKRVWEPAGIAAVCFTDPEVVTVGLSPDEAKAAGHETVIGRFAFKANGRAMTLEQEEGMIRVVARADNHVVLGIQAVGGGVAELSAAFALALEMGARLEDIADTIHTHPTQSEAFPEAAMAALGLGLHA